MSKSPLIPRRSTRPSNVEGGSTNEIEADHANPFADLVAEINDGEGFAEEAIQNAPEHDAITGQNSHASMDHEHCSAQPRDMSSIIAQSVNRMERNPVIETSVEQEPVYDPETFEPRYAKVQPSQHIDAEHLTEADIDDAVRIPERHQTATSMAAVGAEHQDEQTPSKRRPMMRGLMACAALLLGVVGTGYLYLQGSQPASSEAVVYEVPVFDDAVTERAVSPAVPSAMIEKPEQTTPEVVVAAVTPKVETVQPPAPTETPKQVVAAVNQTQTPSAPLTERTVPATPFGFNDKFSDEFPELEGQSLLDLATGIATYAPADFVPTSEWDEVSCGGCHSFNQTNLCEQGAYYFNHDKARIARIQHPYGGGFKTKLMEWAEGGCQ